MNQCIAGGERRYQKNNSEPGGEPGSDAHLRQAFHFSTPSEGVFLVTLVCAYATHVREEELRERNG
jgi:hypothetical protein